MYFTRNGGETHDMRVFVEAGVVRVDMNDHDSASIADEEVLEDLRQLGVAEGYDSKSAPVAKRRWGSHLLLVGSKDLDTLAKDLVG